jgi:predicted nucleotidyltransferase component of viral defense system
VPKINCVQDKDVANMSQYYRQATAAELAFYTQTLYPLQDAVFEVAALYGDKLYLTGGTALARFYFNHRLSEALDFFTTTDDLKLIANDLRLRLLERGFVVQMDKLEVYFARFYVQVENVSLKIDFAKEFNLVDPLQLTTQGIYINSLEDLGANKITAFEDRAAIKDVIDLYYITQQIPFPQLFQLADQKRVPVAYEQLLAINTTGITGQALVTEALSESALLEFVARLTRETAAEVKKKEKKRTENLDPLLQRLLWDFPPERRGINADSRPVLKQRLRTLPLPDRNALAKQLG